MNPRPIKQQKKRRGRKIKATVCNESLQKNLTILFMQ